MLVRSPAILTALLGAALAAGCGGPAAEAIRADREGRSAEALRLYVEAAAAAGVEASAELRFNLGRAALAAGDLEGAGAAAEAAVARAAPRSEEAGRAAFLAGCVAFRRGAEVEAGAPDPRARAAAATRYEDALLAFGNAAADMADGAGARRNAERALLALERVRGGAKRVSLPDPRGLPPGPPPGLEPPPGSKGAEGEGAGEAAPEDLPGEIVGEGAGAAGAAALSPAEVAAVLDRLAALERVKAAARRARREERGAAVEKDW